MVRSGSLTPRGGLVRIAGDVGSRSHSLTKAGTAVVWSSFITLLSECDGQQSANHLLGREWAQSKLRQNYITNCIAKHDVQSVFLQ